MRRAGRRVDPHGVRDALPFGVVIALGAFCSVAAIVVGRPGPAAAPAAGLPDSSAPTAIASNGVPTLVTDPPPVDRLIATEHPAPATDGAPPGQTPVAVPDPDPGVRSARDNSPASQMRPLPAALTEPRVPLVDSDKATLLFEQMNNARADEGLPPFEWDDQLAAVAASRAASLARNGYFDHYGPDGSSAFSELTARGIAYRLAGENLARNNYGAATTAAVAFEALMGSPGHRANILEPRFNRSGVAAVRDGRYWLYVTVFTD